MNELLQCLFLLGMAFFLFFFFLCFIVLGKKKKERNKGRVV